MYKLCKTEQSTLRQIEFKLALLHLMEQKNYFKITITDICKEMNAPPERHFIDIMSLLERRKSLMANNINLSEITFRQLEIFLAVAKYENFTQASEKLYITQASVSRNIQNLEDALGLILFVRHKGRTSLTKAGKSLANDVAQIFQRTHKAIDAAFLQQQNEFCNLMIGDVNCTPVDYYLLPAAREFESRYPNINLTIERENIKTILSNLQSGKYDASYIISVFEPDILKDGLKGIRVCQLPPCVIMSNTHPLFENETITLQDIQNQPLVAMQNGLYKYYWEFARKVCSETGINTDNVKFVDNSFSLAMELKRHKCIAILDQLFTPMSTLELRYIPLMDCKIKSGITLVFDDNNSNPYLTKYISLCREIVPK